MNELKSNNKIISRSEQSGNSSNVSTYVKREEKTYVQRYSMNKKKLSDWIYNNLDGDEESILHPKIGRYKAEEAASDSDNRKRAKILLLCIGIALVMLLIIPAVKIATTYLVIGEVRVEGSSLYSYSDLLDAGNLKMGDSLPLFSSDDAEKKILENLPYVQSCKMSFELPNVLILSVIDEAPALYTKIENEYFVLTSSMRILERTASDDGLSELLYIELPRVENATVGCEMILKGTSVEYITEFFRLINNSPLKDRLGIVYFDQKFDIVASVDGKFRVLFGSPFDMEYKIASVSKMIEENGEKCLSAGIIDVRITDVCGITLEAAIDPNARE